MKALSPSELWFIDHDHELPRTNRVPNEIHQHGHQYRQAGQGLRDVVNRQFCEVRPVSAGKFEAIGIAGSEATAFEKFGA